MNYNEQICDCHTLTQQQVNYLIKRPNKHLTLVKSACIDQNTGCQIKQLCTQETQFYSITGIFCSCLIFAVFCGSIEIAEIKNRKIFQSRYNDEIVSEVIVQSRIFSIPVRYFCGIICIMGYTKSYNVHLDMRLSCKWHTVFEI